MEDLFDLMVISLADMIEDNKVTVVLKKTHTSVNLPAFKSRLYHSYDVG